MREEMPWDEDDGPQGVMVSAREPTRCIESGKRPVRGWEGAQQCFVEESSTSKEVIDWHGVRYQVLVYSDGTAEVKRLFPVHGAPTIIDLDLHTGGVHIWGAIEFWPIPEMDSFLVRTRQLAYELYYTWF